MPIIFKSSYFDDLVYVFDRVLISTMYLGTYLIIISGTLALVKLFVHYLFSR